MTIKRANAYFREGKYEQALVEYESIKRSNPFLHNIVESSIHLCQKRLREAADRSQSKLPQQACMISSGSKLIRVRFNPDYSISNPYQTLLYSDCPPNYSILAGDISEAQQDLSSGEFSCVFFHLHWLSPILAGAAIADDAQRNIDDYLFKIKDFLQKGGQLVWTIHNLFEHDVKFPLVELRFRTELAQLASVIHVHSESALKQIAEHYSLPSDKVVVQQHGHYIGVYPDVVSRPLARAYLGLNTDDIVFLSLGQIRPYKGIETLLAAFSAFQKEEGRARLVIAGKPVHPYSAEILRHYLRGYTGITLRLENIPDTELQYYFRAADAAVLTYRQMLTSGSVLLAESFGTACIGPDVPGLNDVIRHDQSGFLYDPDKPIEGLQACFSAISSRTTNDLKKLHLAAKSDAEQRHWRNAVKNLFVSNLPECESTKTHPQVKTRYINIEQSQVQCKIIERGKRNSNEYQVGIVILNYKNIEDTSELVQSISRLERTDLLVAIVDNASPNLSLIELDAAFPQCDVIRTNANLGYAAGNNVGIQYLKEFNPRYIWILNPDTVIQTSTLNELLMVAEAEKSPSIWGSIITYYENPKKVWFAGGFVHLGQSCQIGHLFFNQNVTALVGIEPYCVDYITGASIFCRSEIFEKNGLIPENYFLYFEETDWCQKAKIHGIQLKINPKSQLLHKKRSESDNGLPKNYYFYYFIRSAIIFRKKYIKNPLDQIIQEVKTSFVNPWLLRIKKNHPTQLAFFERLSEIAITDAANGVSGQRNLDNLFTASTKKINNQEADINLTAKFSEGNLIEGQLTIHELSLTPMLNVFIDGKLVGDLTYVEQHKSLAAQSSVQHLQNHSFKYLIQSKYIDGATHLIQIYTEDKQCLWQINAKLEINKPRYKGYIDNLNNRVIRGWCIDLLNPQFPINVELQCRGEVIGIGKANLERPDLLEAGYPTSMGGFEFTIPLRFCHGGTYEFTLISKDTGIDITRKSLFMNINRIPTINGVVDDNDMENWFFKNRELSFSRKENAESKWVKSLEGRAYAYFKRLYKNPQVTLVSVIMPVFNRERVLRQAICSIASQSYSNWELLIIDDGSQDQSVKTVNLLAKELKIENKISVIELKNNVGVSAARNKGLAHAKGRLIAYLDSDNTWDRDFLLVMVNELNRMGDYACVYCADRIKQIYTKTGKEDDSSEIIGLRYGRLHRTLLENKNYIDLNVFMHTRDLFETLGGFDEDMRRLVDWDLILRYAQVADIEFVPAILATYCFGASDNQISATENYQKNALTVLSKIGGPHRIPPRLSTSGHKDHTLATRNELQSIHIYLYFERDYEESEITLACSTWKNAFKNYKVSITLMVNSTTFYGEFDRARLSKIFNAHVVFIQKEGWYLEIGNNEFSVNNNDTEWYLITPLNTSPGRDFENSLEHHISLPDTIDCLIPSLMRSNLHAVKSNTIFFCNSITDAQYDFQPLTSTLSLSNPKGIKNGYYDVINASAGSILLNFGKASANERLLFLKQLFLNNNNTRPIEIFTTEQLRVRYSQNLRIHEY